MISSVIDIGSNSIKLLVAEGENATPIFETLSETRLSPHCESARERIDDVAFAAGIRAVSELAQRARAFAPAREAIVGTSLFRTAENARDFAAAVESATGTPMKILSGTEEAELVAEGVATDPAAGTPCAIFDLGGGSLEFIAKADDASPIFAVSRPLGAVRMSRKFFKNSAEKIALEKIAALRMFTRESLADFLPGKIPANAHAVFCGGGAGIFSHLLNGKNSARELENLLAEIAQKTFAERVESGVPEKRADIFPAALAVFAEICAIGKFQNFMYTRRNLRYGLCARLNRGK